jgi:hypothetical protein
MYRGSCLCGAVTFQVEGELGDAYYCHCSRCRKASGSAFASNARIAPEQFKLLTGHDVLRSYYNQATGLTRKFCGECGSPIVSERTEPRMLAIRLGTLDTSIGKGPQGHIFVGSKANWHQITDDLPQYQERPVKS